MTHISEAQTAAEVVDNTDISNPAYERRALRGILHALLALHEQNEPKSTRTRTTTPKAADK